VPKGVYERKPMPEETRAKISAALTGITRSPETRAKMSAAKMGHAPSITQWKGENIRYGAAHYRADQVLPLECAHTDASCKGKLDIALRHDAPTDLLRYDDLAGLVFFVGDSTQGYMRLCRSHHRRYDA
jgi:hypothetical protein